MNPQEVYLARQPIVDVNQELVGFELLFRPTATDRVEVDDNLLATSTVISNVFTEIGLEQVIGQVDGYINVDADFLFSALIDTLPPGQIVLELREQKIVDQTTIERCGHLRQHGYRIAIDDFVGNFDGLDQLLPAVDMVKVDFERIDPLLIPEIVKMLEPYPAKLIAQKIETPAQFTQAKALGIALFQGYHFARPQLLTAKRARPAEIALLRLLQLALEDSETHEIEQEFKRHPNLSVNLLRLVNSAASGLRQQITSMRHALVLLGRRRLKIWLQLLLYTADRSNRSLGSPLLQMAAVRGKLMELIAGKQVAGHDAYKELAFIAGILSLMDVLLKMPLPEILDQLHLPEAVRAALLRREGDLGALLTLTEQLEQQDTEGVAKSLQANGSVGASTLMSMQVSAFQWANELVAQAA